MGLDLDMGLDFDLDLSLDLDLDLGLDSDLEGAWSSSSIDFITPAVGESFPRRFPS